MIESLLAGSSLIAIAKMTLGFAPFMFGAGSPGQAQYQIPRSLRFRASAGARLSRTFGGAPTSRKAFTITTMIKRGALGTNQMVFNASNGAASENTLMYIYLNTSDKLVIQLGGTNYRISTRVFRDVGAFFRLTIAFDTANATAQSRIRAWVNNDEITAWDTNGTLASGTDTAWGQAWAHMIGSLYDGSSFYADMLMADFQVIDGQALDYTAFDALDPVTGAYVPKAYSGSYGNYGFRLDFSDNSTTANLGVDRSGNSQTWAVTNFSVTAGVTNDSLVDTPTNYGIDTGLGGEVRGNYATFNAIDRSISYMTVSGANLTAASTGTASIYSGVRGNQALPAGALVYWEYTISSMGYDAGFGICDRTVPLEVGSNVVTTGNFYNVGFSANGGGIFYSAGARLPADSAGGSAWGAYPALVNGDVLGVAVNLTTGKMWFRVNGVWLNTSGTANPATDTDPRFSGISNSIQWFPVFGTYHTPGTATNVNFGQRPFANAAPSGFKALCTQNLPDPVIKKPSDYFDVNLRAGTGAAANVTGKAFAPDLVWIKGRSAATDHAWYDTSRGVQKDIGSNLGAAETTQAQGVTAFNSDGFSIGTLAKINTNAAAYVEFLWKKGVSAGFDIVTGTGTGTSGTLTVPHALGVVPSLVIVKNRDLTDSWFTWHSSLGASASGYIVKLDSTVAATTSGVWSTGHTSSNILVNQGSLFSGSGQRLIGYVFAAVAGFSAFGSYIGNGVVDGPFINCQFRPRFILIKRADSAENWQIIDTARNAYNLGDLTFFPNLTDAENSGQLKVDVTSGGFKLRTSNTFSGNTSGGTYIYAAFAEAPFKYARAR